MANQKLTKTLVERLEPRASEYEIRDTLVPGFLVKITPAASKVFMIAYTNSKGQRRKPALGRFGEITVEQARNLARDWLADVRCGRDPCSDRQSDRSAPTMKTLCERFINDYSIPRNKPSTVEGNRDYIRAHIVPALGGLKVPDVSRAEVAQLIGRLEDRPVAANHVLACLRKMFNMAEVWGYRQDGSNPCRHIPKYPERGSTRLITDSEIQRLFRCLDQIDKDGSENPFLTLAIRLQFEFAARMSEILTLQWDWVDVGNRRVVWPDSKTGGMSKPLGSEAARLLQCAPKLADSPFVIPSIRDPNRPMPKHTYYGGWRRVLDRAEISRVGTHAIRHRAATDIANSGIPLKVGMSLTAHKTVSMFMRYVHTEDDPVKAAADIVAQRRRETVLRS